MTNQRCQPQAGEMLLLTIGGHAIVYAAPPG
jgi:hypothetical protein